MAKELKHMDIVEHKGFLGMVNSVSDNKVAVDWFYSSNKNQQLCSAWWLFEDLNLITSIPYLLAKNLEECKKGKTQNEIQAENSFSLNR